MRKRRVAALLIDADGVLLKKGALFSERLSVSQKIPKSKIDAFFNREFRDCLVGRADVSEKIENYLKDWKWAGSVEDLLDFWHREIEPDAALFNWALALRKRRRVLVYLATNNESRRVSAISKRLGLAKRFDGILSSASLGATKPAQLFYGRAFKTLRERSPGILKSQIVLVDDDRANVKGAEEFGFGAIRYSGFSEFSKKIRRIFPELAT